MIKEKLAELVVVLNSSRFQAAIGAIVLHYLKSQYGLDPMIADSLIALCLTHIGIRTIDRTADAIGGRK